MAASHVQTLTPFDEAVSGTSVALTPNAATTAGNLLVVAIEAQGNDVVSSVTDTQGNTWVVDSGIANGTVTGLSLAYTFQDVAGLSTSDTITATLTSSPAKIISCDEFSGILSRDSSTTATGTDTAPSATGALASQADSLFYCAVAYAGVGGAFTPGAGFTGTLDHNFTDASVARDLATEYRIVSAAEAPAYGGSLSTSRQWALIGIAFAAEAPGGGAGPQTIPAGVPVQDSSVKVPAAVDGSGSADLPAEVIPTGASVPNATVDATGSAPIVMDSFGSGAIITPVSVAVGAAPGQTIPAAAVADSASVGVPLVAATGGVIIPGPANGDPGSIHTATVSPTGGATIPGAVVASGGVLTPDSVGGGSTLSVPAALVASGATVPVPTVDGSGSAHVTAVRVQDSSVKVPVSVAAGTAPPIPAELVASGAVLTPGPVIVAGNSLIDALHVDSGAFLLPVFAPTGTVHILGLREQGTSVKKPKSVTAGAPVPNLIPAALLAGGVVYAPESVSLPPGTPQTITAVRVQNSSVKIPTTVHAGNPTIRAIPVDSGSVQLASMGGGNPVPNVWGWGEGHMETLASDERARIMATVRAACGARGVIRCDLDTTNFALTQQSKYLTFDAEVAAHDLVWLPVLHSTWSSSSGHSRYQIPPRDGGAGQYAMQSWYEWVYYIVTQTQKHVYEVWNEPNTTTGNGKSGASGDMAYADLQDIVEAATDAIRDAAADGGFDVPYIIGPALGSIDVAYLEGWIDWAQANGRRNPIDLYDAQSAHVYPVEDPTLAGALDKPRRIRTMSLLRDLIDARYTGPGQSPDLAMTEWSYANDSRAGANKFNGNSEPIIWEEPADGAANAYDYTVGLLDQISAHPEWRLTYRTAYHPIDHNPAVTATDHKYESFGAFYNSTGTGAIPENLWKGNGRAISERALSDAAAGGTGTPQVIPALRIQDSSVKIPTRVASAAAVLGSVIQAITVMPCYTGSTQTSLSGAQETVVPLASQDQELSL